MAVGERTQSLPVAGAAEPILATGTRIDPAHHVAGSADSQVAADQPLAAISPAMVEGLRLQAEQLSAYLKAQQKDLDHRETQLNVRSAELDRSASSARLWLTERHHELDQRAEELRQQQQDVERKLAELGRRQAHSELSTLAVDQSLDQRERELAELTAQLDARQAEQEATIASLKAEAATQQETAALLAVREQRFTERRREAMQLVQDVLKGGAAAELEKGSPSGRRKKSKPQPAQPVRDNDDEALRELSQAAQQLLARQAHLDEAERLQAATAAELEQCRHELEQDQKAFQREMQEGRQQLFELRQRTEAELHSRQVALQARAEALGAREAAAEQMKSDVSRMHREALELRLATEELWSQLAANVPVATLTQSLGQLRAKLADHYRLATAELAQRKQELESLASRLAEQHEKLASQKAEVQAWVERRQQEIEQQAATLVAREQQLDEQDQRYAELQRQWAEQRSGYQRQIRTLMAELRSSPVRLAVA